MFLYNVKYSMKLNTYTLLHYQAYGYLQHDASLYLSKYDEDIFPLKRNPYKIDWQGYDKTQLSLYHLKQIFTFVFIGILLSILIYFSETTVTACPCKKVKAKKSAFKMRDSILASGLYALTAIVIITILVSFFKEKERGTWNSHL